MSTTLRRDPVCSCPITDHRGKRLEANELWLYFKKKTCVAAINIALGVPGQRADKADSGTDGSFLCVWKLLQSQTAKQRGPKFRPVSEIWSEFYFLESAEPRTRHSAPPPPRCTGSSLVFQSHRSEFRIPHTCTWSREFPLLFFFLFFFKAIFL